MMSSGTQSGSSTSAKRTSSSLQSSGAETLGSAVKLGGVSRDKERKEKEDVELIAPWDLAPFAPDTSAGTPSPQHVNKGYPDFYPSKGDEEEYKLTEKAITEGFENKPIVTVIFILGR
jgi:hypothetical protein